jgi:ubiquinone/menaquinone biosynthesis C-methylase UbiE
MASIWDLYATVYDSLPKNFKPYQELVEEIVGEVRKCSDKGRVLDAGCGTGNYSLALAKLGYDVTGIDFSESMLKRADKKKGNINSGNLQFLRLDLTGKLPYPDNYFDCLLSIHSLYTISETGPVLNEYYRVLRPNGTFVLSELQHPIAIIPCLKEAKQRDGVRAAINVFCHLFLIGIFNFIIAERQVTGFYHYWSESELRKKLLEAGFKIISVKETYTDNVDFLVISTKNEANIGLS